MNPDGTEKWSFNTKYNCDASPAIADDGTIYIDSGLEEPELFAVHPNGTEKWSFDPGFGGTMKSSPAVAEDGTIYYGSVDENLYAVNPDGTEKWRFETEGTVHSSPAIGEDGTIYFGSSDSYLYALNPDGTEKWNFYADGYVRASPSIGSDGSIYFGSYDNNLYSINPDGTERWSFETDDIIRSSPSIGSDGTIYIGSNDNHLYAIGEKHEPEEYTLMIEEPTGNGTVEVDGDEVTEWPYEEMYEYGTEVELRAIPEVGWQFEEWTGTDKPGDEITITMDEDKDITAVFEKIDFVEFEVNIIEPDDGEEFQVGDDIRIEFEVHNFFGDRYEVDIVLLIYDEDENVVDNETWEEEIEGDDSFEGSYIWEAEDSRDYDIKLSVHDPLHENQGEGFPPLGGKMNPDSKVYKLC